MDIDTQFSTPHGQYRLRRLPLQHHPSLRAWDAADDYLIQAITDASTGSGQTLVLNDDFGALSIGLLPQQPVIWFDSAVEAGALAMNLSANELPPLTMISQTELPPTEPVSRVVLKIPRNSALLDWQLAMINRHLPAGTPVLLGGMLKHVTPADQKVMATRLQDLTHSRIVRKARYWQGVTRHEDAIPQPEHWSVPEVEFSLVNRAGVFSARRPDPGAVCLLQHFSDIAGAELPEQAQVLDLCCGNGILGLAWQQRFRTHSVYFSDASAAAIDSVHANWQRYCQDSGANSRDSAPILHQDGLRDTPDLRFNLILCNPPFHQADTVTTDVSRELFRQARYALQPQGQLIVVANRHLGYHRLLRADFQKVAVLSGDKRFVVMAASQPN